MPLRRKLADVLALLFAMAFTIVKLTNAKFAGHGEAKAGQTK